MARVTQVPVLYVWDDVEAESEAQVTQIPVIYVYSEAPPMNVTQVVIQQPALWKPLRAGKPVVPEVPVTERWQYLTITTTLDNGGEQRSRLREYPRHIMELNYLMLSDEERRAIHNMILRFSYDEFLFSLFHLSTPVTSDAAESSSQLVFDPDRTDIRDGEYISVMPPTLDDVFMYEIDTVNGHGCSLVDPLDMAIPAGWFVCPTINFRLPGNVGYNMRNIAGDTTITMESTRPRVFLRPGSTASLTTFDGYPVIEDRPVNDVSNSFNQNINWIDNGIGIPQPFKHWPVAFWSTEVTYQFNRVNEIDYWRAFASYTKGAQNPFILPTFRNDLPLVETPAVDARFLISDNIDFYDYWNNGGYRYIQISTANGIIYRKIDEVQDVRDANGDIYRVQIELNTALPGNVGDNVINWIAFAPLCRLADDQFILTHHPLESEIKFFARQVNA